MCRVLGSRLYGYGFGAPGFRVKGLVFQVLGLRV